MVAAAAAAAIVGMVAAAGPTDIATAIVGGVNGDATVVGICIRNGAGTPMATDTGGSSIIHEASSAGVAVAPNSTTTTTTTGDGQPTGKRRPASPSGHAGGSISGGSSSFRPSAPGGQDATAQLFGIVQSVRNGGVPVPTVRLMLLMLLMLLLLKSLPMLPLPLLPLLLLAQQGPLMTLALILNLTNARSTTSISQARGKVHGHDGCGCGCGCGSVTIVMVQAGTWGGVIAATVHTEPTRPPTTAVYTGSGSGSCGSRGRRRRKRRGGRGVGVLAVLHGLGVGPR